MARSSTLEEEINEFIDTWGSKELISFLNDVIPLLELYDVDEADDWVQKELSADEEHVRTVRLIRTVYLMSRIAEFHAGKMCSINIKFKNLWKRMEKQRLNETDVQEESLSKKA